MTEKVPILVVLGLDIDEKPHASRFEEHEAPVLLRTAELMGFHLVRVPPEKTELHEVAAGLPAGKVFASGRAFVPFVARSVFDKLAALVEGGVTIEQRCASGAPPVEALAAMFTTESINTADALWSNVEVGSIVLAAQPKLYGQCWWEGVVVEVKGDQLTIRWMDDPSLKPFRMSRREVALLHPGLE